MGAVDKSLTSCHIKEGTRFIGDNAFVACNCLTSIYIPNSVTSIGENAFSLCTSLSAVNISDIVAWCGISFNSQANPLSYAHNLFLNDEIISELIIPNSVMSISDYAFSNCI